MVLTLPEIVFFTWAVYSDVRCNYTHIAIIDTYLDCEVTTYAMVHSLSEVVTSYCLK